MMSEWKTCTLGDVVEVKYGKDHKSLSDGQYSCFGSGGFMRSVDSFLYDGESILIPRKGSLNNIMYQEKPFWTIDTMFWTKVNKEKANPKFLFYQLTPIDYTTLNVGSAVPSLTVPVINEIEILLPPLPEQKAIGEVLSSLDDKIDLLHRQNKTLESLAETLFRHHFIENAQPDWEEKQLDEIADYLNGLACQKHPPKNDTEKLPVLKIKELRNGFTEKSDWATIDVDGKYIVKNGDVIFSWSGSLLVKIWDGKDCVLNQHLFKVTSEEYPKWFIYHWTKYHLYKFTAIAESKATTMGHIKRSDLSNSMVVVPTEDALNELNQIMQPIIDKVILNNKQIYKLEKLRDTMLPKLISGDVRVQYNINNKTEEA